MIPLHPVPGRRFKPSGPNIPLSKRGTEVLQVRCSPELAAQVRAFVDANKANGMTLARVLAAGLNSLTMPEAGERLAYERGHAEGYVAGRLAADEER